MDLSKLPKLSQTPPPPADNAAPVAPGDSTARQGSAGAAAPNVELFCRCGAPIMPGTNFCSNCGANYYEATGGRSRSAAGLDSGGMWVEALISLAFGLFLLMMAPGGIKYLSATMAGRPYTPYAHPTEPGQFVDYKRYENSSTGVITDYKYRDMFDAYWSDMVLTAFALVLILDAVVLAFVRNRWAILIAAVLTTAATLLNLWYAAASYSRTNPITGQSYGLAMLSMMVVIAGVAMAGYQWRAFADARER
jgi:hypothetical protein